MNEPIVFSLEIIAKLLEIRLGKVFRKADDPDLNILNILCANGLIEPEPGNPDVWIATPKAVTYTCWLCEVPLPAMKWIDPRKEK